MATATPALSLPHRVARPSVRPPTHFLDTGPRFTTDGSSELEQHLVRTCRKIAAGVRGLLPRRQLEGILLGGGYGRGEGGVLRTPEGDRPYNDLEFYVFMRGSRHWQEYQHGRALHVLGQILTPQAGVDVEFKIASRRELAAAPVSMFSYDLVVGHRWLHGAESLLADCGHHRDAEQIPLSEATRLLMNRCSGLLFARERIARTEFTAADADFVCRNIAKAELGLGDAVLTCFGLYHSSVHQRHANLQRIAARENLPWLGEVVRRHAAGVEFKLHPERSTATRDELFRHHQAVTALASAVWLWVEEWRLRARIRTTRDYGLSRTTLCPETDLARNAIINARLLGLRPLWQGTLALHPRERILRALALLLWEPDALQSPRLLRRVQMELNTSATTLPAVVRAYQALWSRVN